MSRGVALTGLLLLAACDAPHVGGDGAADKRGLLSMIFGAPRYSITAPLPPPLPAMELPDVQGPEGRPLVVIDPGHGGHDPGAASPDLTLREEAVTLAIADAIRDELLERGRVRVALARDDDRYLMLRERYEIARKLGADLFVSIHADAAANREARGATIYTLSETASDAEAALLAQRENKADIVSGVDLASTGTEVTSILIDLAQRETMEEAAAFARLLEREARPRVPFREVPLKRASLIVLKAPDVPSVLFEAGYISNAEDAAFLSSAEGREAIAEGFARAIEIHFARRVLR